MSVPADTHRERRLQLEAQVCEAGRLEVAAGGVIGIDWGIVQALTLSTGEVIQLPRVTAAEQDRLCLLYTSDAADE